MLHLLLCMPSYKYITIDGLSWCGNILQPPWWLLNAPLLRTTFPAVSVGTPFSLTGAACAAFLTPKSPFRTACSREGTEFWQKWLSHFFVLWQRAFHCEQGASVHPITWLPIIAHYHAFLHYQYWWGSAMLPPHIPTSMLHYLKPFFVITDRIKEQI